MQKQRLDQIKQETEKMQHELSKMGEELSIAKRLVHVHIYEKIDLFLNMVKGTDLCG